MFINHAKHQQENQHALQKPPPFSAQPHPLSHFFSAESFPVHSLYINLGRRLFDRTRTTYIPPAPTPRGHPWKTTLGIKHRSLTGFLEPDGRPINPIPQSPSWLRALLATRTLRRSANASLAIRSLSPVDISIRDCVGSRTMFYRKGNAHTSTVHRNTQHRVRCFPHPID